MPTPVSCQQTKILSVAHVLIFLETPSFSQFEPLCFPERKGDWMTAQEMEDRFLFPTASQQKYKNPVFCF
jgi:hypothetical protein